MDFQSLADITRHFAITIPDNIAIRYDQRDTSWQDWDRISNQVANALAGGAFGARIAYLGKNSDRVLHLLFGCAKSGMVLTPINWRLAVDNICFILEDAECEILFLDPEFTTVLETVRQRCPQLRLCISTESTVPGLPSIQDWLAVHPYTDPVRSIDKDDVVLQLYTSGTTGKPKGVQLTHRNLLFSTSLSRIDRLGNWRGDDVCVLPTPLFHAGGLGFGLCAPAAGAMLIVVRGSRPEDIIQAFKDAPKPVTRIGLVPAMFRPLIEHTEFPSLCPLSLRSVTYGGSPIALPLLRSAMSAFGPVMTQLFGMTETATVATALEPADHDHPERLLSCGRPLPGVDVRIVLPDGTPAKVGESGQVTIRCDSVMKGYWKRPLETTAVLSDGTYRTGDVGYLDGQGYLYLQDRLQDMIISGGENIYPTEVETVLMEHPEIADAGVFGVPDPKWGEAVKAAVVLKQGANVTADDIIAFSHARLGGFRSPKSVDFMDALPRNETGKVLRRVLREPYWQDLKRRVS